MPSQDPRLEADFAAALAGNAHDIARRDYLAGMSLGMLGCMENQPENIAGKLRAPYGSGREELSCRHTSEAAQGGIDCSIDQGEQVFRCRRRIPRVGLFTDGRKLVVIERFPPRIGEEPIKASGDMPQMEADRRGAARASPEIR